MKPNGCSVQGCGQFRVARGNCPGAEAGAWRSCTANKASPWPVFMSGSCGHSLPESLLHRSFLGPCRVLLLGLELSDLSSFELPTTEA